MFSATPSKDRAAKRRKPKQTPDYFSRREQYRLLVLVGLVMIVVVLMSEAGKPKNWAWMWGNEVPVQEDVAQEDFSGEPIDTRLNPTSDATANNPDLIRIYPAPLATSEEEAGEGEEGDYFPGVRSSLLSTIQDDRVFQNSASEAWYNLLDVLGRTEQADLDEASIGNVSYLQLYNQSDVYRGRLVSLKGMVHRVQELPATKNVHNIERWYQCTLYPKGGPHGQPILIYCLDLPEGFPRDLKMYQEVHLTGFFYKRLAYEAGDGLNSAPLILAKTVTWDRFSVAPTETPPWTLLLVVVLGAAIIAVSVAVWAYNRSEARSKQSVSYNLSTKFDSVDLKALKDLDISPNPRFPDKF